MNRLKNINCIKLEKCKVPRFYRLMGKKWVFPIFCRIENNVSYRFEDFIQISRKNIHRTTLSYLLKELIRLEILEKSGRYYNLSKKGIKIKKDIIHISKIILNTESCYEISDYVKNKKSDKKK